MMFPNGDVPNTPVEVLESRYPAVRVERFAFRTDGVGAGLHRGGMGVVREYRILEDGILMQTVTENTRDQLGKGVGGGGIGGQPAIVIRPDSEDEVRLTERVTYFGPLEAGVRIRVLSPGGGGWGDPRRRDAEQVARDVRDELVSAEEAREVFGVVLAADGSVDEDATSALRR
jgi:N-methylhydantoinase B